MSSPHERFARATRAALADPALGRLLDAATTRLIERRADAVAAAPDWEELRERARAIKADTLARLDRHLLAFERAATAAGAQVHWAATADAACRTIVNIARRHGATLAVKGKSMVSEEIHLNAALEANGITPVETDLAEFIVQLAGEAPSHIIIPALHKSRQDVSRLFSEKLGMPPTDDVAELTAEARRRLRARFAAATLGVSGANFGVADTGTIVTVENEGNIRMATSMPGVHVALMGIERVIPRVADLEVFLRLLPASATGQSMATYVSFLTGPRRPDELDGPVELHVILLDNGRSTLLADPTIRPALACIRCGACLNACPVYRTIGGHAYGTVYGGPIGSVISAYLDPRGTPPDLPYASSLCGACTDVCPVKIDLPSLLVYRRTLAARGVARGAPMPGRAAERRALRLWAFVMRSPRRYRLASRVVRLLARLTSARGRIRRLPGLARGWTRVRDLPAPASRTFLQIWEERPNRPGTDA